MALLPGTPRDQGKLVVALAAIALAVVFFLYVYGPRNEELALVEEHVEKLDRANDLAKRELARGSVGELRAQAQRYAQNLEVMRQLVPTGNEVPALLEQVSTAARRAGLDLSTVDPQPVIEGDQFDTYRYKLSVFGTYHQVGEFLTNVGSLTRIVAPQNVSLVATLDPAASKVKKKIASHALIDTDFEIQTYVAKTPAPASGRDRPRRAEGTD